MNTCWDWYNLHVSTKIKKVTSGSHQMSLPRQGITGVLVTWIKFNSYLVGKSNPCVLDTGNPCRSDGYFNISDSAESSM